MKRPHWRIRGARGRGVKLFPDSAPGILGAVLHHLRSGISYGLVAVVGVLTVVFFRVLNSTRIIGRKNIPFRTNVLLVSNHRTMFDSFLVASMAYFPAGLLYPKLPPYHAAAQENFFRWYHLGLFRLLRCIPVRTGRRDLEAMNAIKEALAQGNVHLFYQGRRTDNLEEARDGIGYIIYNARPTVVPVYVEGLEHVFGRKWEIRSIFRKIKIVYGKSIDFMDLYALPNTKETWASITQRIVQHVKLLALETGERAS
jgi:1-acyl-sn-glycerol-3-phosphate acyltransferase